MTLSEELTWRGLAYQSTYADLKVLDHKKHSFYWGVDPSADSMTVGNLAAAMMVKCFIRHGQKPVLLVGGATGLIGDPDGKSQERQLIDKATIEKNKQQLVNQFKRLFSGADFKIVDNLEWFKDLSYLDFLREVGKHVPMRQMLGREFVQSRLGESGSGISYAEFSYVLIQAYDFLKLFERHHVNLQVCGADQWGNSVAGVDLIRRKTGGEAHVFSASLIVDQTTGQKFGKSEAGAIWLDPNKTSPTQFYQFWINTPDDRVEAYLKIFTEFGPSEVDKLIKEQTSDPGARPAQRALAEAVTSLVHGQAEAKTAKAITDVIIGKTPLKDVSDKKLLDSLRREIAHLKTKAPVELAEILVSSQLASSKTEARQLLNSNAVYINGQPVNKEQLETSDFNGGRLLIRRGKAYKDSALIELG